MKKKAVTKEKYITKPTQTEEIQTKEAECAYNLIGLDPESLEFALNDLTGKLDTFQFSHSSLLKIRDALRQLGDYCRHYKEEYEKITGKVMGVIETIDKILSVVYPEPIEVVHPIKNTA